MDVASWLRDLGLERYASAFRDNDIDAEVLLKLTAEDLSSIGVTSVGHRRKLLDAIAAPGTAVPTTVVAARAPGALAQVDAERRQLTVMFCDIVGSTALSTRYDPEDLRELIGDYHRAVAETVGRFDGFVAKYMGDGVLIYFGYPQAHEDDAERAVRAALAVVEAVERLPAREHLRVRLGIATGLAVVGDLIGEGAAQERGVVGETPNLAARLQALATPNALVIADATRRQIGGLFDLEDLGPQQLAGFAEPQRAWRVLGESGKVSRFEALRSGETPLVGRDEEIELLRRRWEQAKRGEGRVVLISGEPGIGKSRLTAELSERIHSEPHTRVRYFCSPHHQEELTKAVLERGRDREFRAPARVILPAVPEGSVRDQQEIELQLALGMSLFTTEGFVSDKAAEAYTRAHELAEPRGDERQRFTAVYGLWQSSAGFGRVLQSRELSDRLLELTAGMTDDGMRLQAHHSGWATCLFAGQPAAARKHCEAGRRLYDPERHRSHRLLYGGHDPGACARYFGALASWTVGYPDEALALGREALAFAERLAHPFSLQDTLVWNAMLHVDRGEAETALQRLAALVAEQRLGFIVEPRLIRGAALSAMGALEEAVVCLREGLASRLGALLLRLYDIAHLADALARQAEYEAALGTVMEGLKVQEETGLHQWEAELRRVEGVALFGLKRLEEVPNALEEALRVARSQQAKSYELRAATSLARLWGEQSRRTEALDLLAPVYGWFTEGFDTADLKEAKTLLDQLA